jgi:UDP-N-acetylglucosamine 2-epimerase (non-hydrolysing)
MGRQLRVLTAFGTRPEAIKMAPVVRAPAAADDMDARVCITAQHREMLDQVLDMFAIAPDYDLNLLKPGRDLTDIMVSALQRLRPILAEFQPDLLLIHGDTTTLAASLAAYYQRIAVGHVEAGLRTGNILSRWPEEVNRKVAGTTARLHFEPTERSRANLLAENVPAADVHVTGNTVIDALQDVVARRETCTRSSERPSLRYLRPAIWWCSNRLRLKMPPNRWRHGWLRRTPTSAFRRPRAERLAFVSLIVPKA